MKKQIEILPDWPAWKRQIAERLNASGVSMKDASLRAGLGETFVRDALKRDKSPSVENFAKLMRVIGVGEPEAPSPVRRVVVSAHVQAGAFAETWEWDEGDQYSVFVPDDPALRGLRLYAAETRGPSMNRRYPEGTIVVFANVEETGEEPIAGKRYVVERRRPGGEAEHTVKLLHIDADGKYWLLPESDDPRFQAPISIEDGTSDGDTVAIIGRVCFAVMRE